MTKAGRVSQALPLALATSLAFVSTLAHADTTAIRLNAFPSVSVADGRSTSTITAEVRDLNGRTVPDGTKVVFTTSLGSFRESVITTTGGTARGTGGGEPAGHRDDHRQRSRRGLEPHHHGV